MDTDGFGDEPGAAGDQPGQFFGQPSDQSGEPGPAGPSGAYGTGQFGPQQPGWQPPPGQPGPYFQATAGWPQMAGRRTNSLAIAALCCGIGQFIAGPFAGIPAIILGAISLGQIRASGEDGRGMAMTGLVLGIIGTILFVLFILLVVAFVHNASVNVNNN